MELWEQVGEALGPDYTVEREMGGGGMSRVFLARDEKLGRKVVIKVLSSELAATVSADRFEREIMLAAGLQHPHIVPVLSAGKADQLPFFIMPLVEGESLRERLNRTKTISVRETVRSRTRTPEVSFTATSNLTTFCSRPGLLRWPTSVWLRRSNRLKGLRRQSRRTR